MGPPRGTADTHIILVHGDVACSERTFTVAQSGPVRLGVDLDAARLHAEVELEGC